SWSATSVGASGTANFTLTPGSNTPSGTYPVTLIANSGSLTHTITVFVTVDTSVKVTPQSVNFENQKKKTSSNPKPVTVTNKGSAPLTINSFSFRGLNSRDFTQTNNCPSSLASGASCTINVTFTPGATGSRSATMKITDSDAASPQQISLTGTGT
ncbi:MAG TPA: choice-of-anchor D domain-containing protein, partial [Terriglobia bacterium]